MVVDSLLIKQLSVEIEKKQLLHNIDLNLKTGDLCVICGKNGAGKTTLLKTLMHHFSTKITAGTITFNRQKINLLKTSDIAHLGFFFIPQHSCELPGIQTLAFLKTLNSSLKNPLPFDQLFNHVHQTLKTLALPEDILTRNLNVNFSGGQRKKTEILQASIAHPKV
jgi:Fe-S cluster assembly ATP-binding protein